MVPDYPHPLTFELADGRVYQWLLMIEGDGSLSSVHAVRPQFYQVNGGPATIEALSANLTPYSNFGSVTEDITGNVEWIPRYYRIDTEYDESVTFDATTGEAMIYQDGSGVRVDRLNHTITKNGKPLIELTTSGGFVTQATDTQTGATVTYTRDPAGDLVQVTGADGLTQTYTYASGSRLSSYTVPGIAPELFAYDDQGRIIEHVAPGGVLTFTQYDDAKSRIIQRDAAGNTVTTTYGNDGHILSVTDPLGHTTSFTYLPGSNRMASRTDPLGHTWTFQYDASGRQSKLVDPLGNALELAYDSATGQVTSIKDQEGRTFLQPLDPLGRPSALVLPSGGTARSLSYPTTRVEPAKHEGRTPAAQPE